MKNILFALLAIAAAGTGGFLLWQKIVERPPHTRQVAILEATKSVLPEAQAEAFTAVENGVDGLQRGDEMIVMPLTGDAATEAPGKILRFRVREQREAFDADLKKTKKQIHDGMERLKAETIANPFTRTDLFGSLRLAAEEKPKRATDKFILTVLSDLIQDTREMNFTTDAQLADEASAKKLAASLMRGRETMWSGAHVFLGQLRSEDLKRLPPSRRNAIRAFWLEFFRLGGAAEVTWATDGTGQLADFLRLAREGGVR